MLKCLIGNDQRLRLILVSDGPTQVQRRATLSAFGQAPGGGANVNAILRPTIAADYNVHPSLISCGETPGHLGPDSFSKVLQNSLLLSAFVLPFQ